MNISLLDQKALTRPSRPTPLGSRQNEQAVNIAVHASSEVPPLLHLYKGEERKISLRFEERTGTIWHIAVDGDWSGHSYTIEVDGQELLDPYARLVDGPHPWRSQREYHPKAMILSQKSAFDWQGVVAPRHSKEELIIYEAHLRGFTAHPSSNVQHPGTYLGFIEKIPYLKELGITAVEFLPLQEFWEGEYKRLNPNTGEQLCNYWGYSTVNFFSPASRYASEPRNAVEEFKTLVRELHRAGIEVILDVVYNHTAEGDDEGRTLSFRGLDPSYYLLTPGGRNHNFSGCGNTFNCNHPLVQDLIVDSLCYWVEEMKVDGFRFDLASILGRGEGGRPLSFSPLIDRLSHHPLLAGTKLIAEAWDAGGLYQVGSFYPEYPSWSEWNGRYRDVVRRFLKGTPGHTSAFATAVSGSEDLYSGQSPLKSINFITAHDGFTLGDLVSYQDKNNLENGEDNRDGSNENDSWNCGEEGESTDRSVIELRQRQIRNFLVALFTSQGIPMLTMGDEVGQSKKGNNNTWCQDSESNWFPWVDAIDENGVLTLTKQLIELRQSSPSLRYNRFLTHSDVQWYNEEGEELQWHTDSKFISWLLSSDQLYIAFSAHHEPLVITPPPPPPQHLWMDIFNNQIVDKTISIPSYSSLCLKAVPQN